ncbi:MAG: hypothetical protein M5R36_21580 [Deltaproteobacteria bacterium]|nr:hypothetical protein [Deltaproteobacteria bacterium]
MKRPTRVITLASIAIVASAVLFLGWPLIDIALSFDPLVSNEDADRLVQAVRAGWTREDEAPSVAAPADVVAVIVVANSPLPGKGVPVMVGEKAGADLGDTAKSLGALLRKKLVAGPVPVEVVFSVHLVRDPERILWPALAEMERTFQVGLHGLMRCGDGGCFALPGPVMHARDDRFKKARGLLEKKRGASLAGLNLGGGLYRFVDEAFIENGTGAARLYRASVLTGPLGSTQIREACRIAGDFLIRAQQTSGRWYYEYGAGRDRFNKRGYNLLRHAGTTYAMYQLAEALGDERYADTADSALDYLKQKIEAAPDDPARMYVRSGNSIKLGGSGLALMAFVEKERTRGVTNREKHIMRGLVRHCLLAQNDDGSFESYHAAPGAEKKTRRSIYYPGEAMLGLIRYYHLHPERKDILDAVARAADYLIGERWNMLGIRFNVPPDAWLMLALEELHKAKPEPGYADYAFDIGLGMGSDQWIDVFPQKDYHGGYYPTPPQVTPAGSRSEGLTAAYLIADRLGDEQTKERLFEIIHRAAAFQIGCLIRPEFAVLYPNPRMALGVFRHSPTRNGTRIDYNQHNISGLLVAADILEKRGL